MLGVKKEIDNFSYINIDTLEGINGKLDDSIRDSIIHYNKALDLMKSNSEDIAILELKRAINLNRHFNEALNLLGLLYAYTGEEEKAVEVFKGVISAENNSIKALDYISKINGVAAASSLVFTDIDNSAPKKAEVKKKKKAEPPKVSLNKGSFFENYMLTLKYHVILYIIMFALGAFIFGGSSEKIEPIQNNSNNNDETISQLNATIKELTDKNNALSDENAKQKEQINSFNAEAEKAKYGQRLEEAESLAASRKYEQAADLLVLIKDVEFNGNDKDKYTKLSNEIIPKATWNVYLEGMNYFNTQDYKNASVKLAKSISYGGKWDYTADSYYNLGRSYQNIGDKQNALNTYNSLKERFPNTDYARNADYRISELNK